MKRKAKFRIGQVVSVKSFYGDWPTGFSGPGFKGRKGWRHGWEFGKIVRIDPPKIPPMKKSAPFCYFLDGWPSALVEKDLRAVRRKEVLA